MSQEEVDILKRALAREKASRKAAEAILEAKSAELYETYLLLKDANIKLEKLVKEKTSELSGVFENIIDAYVVMDLWGNVLKMNESAVQLLGYDNQETEFNLLQIADTSEADNVMNAFNELFSNGAVTDFEVKINTKFNGQRLVHINASLILDDKNKPIAAQGIVRDITDITTLQLQKENLLSKLEKSNNELQEYAHIVSHDLKSPLRSIDALVSWIKEDNKDKLDKASLNNFNLIQTTLEKMEQLISDVLDYSSVSEDNTQLVAVDVQVLVDDLLKMLFIPEHINIIVKNHLPIVQGDYTKLLQVFQNLISNAIKFNDKTKGIIEIDVTEDHKFYRFSIKDNGIGIESKFQDKVFKIFHSLKKSKDSSGIGLSIVKKIVELHNGKVWLESEPQKGTIFYFTLKKLK